MAATLGRVGLPAPLAEGGWASRRDRIGRQILDLMAAFAPDLHACVAEYEVLGPPDIEARIGLTGGHIFQSVIALNGRNAAMAVLADHGAAGS